MILRSFYNGAFSIASKHDFDDQFFFACDSTVGFKKNGTRQKKLTQFFWFFNSVKPSFERYVRIMVKIQ
jgi:hypothetical protein